MSRSLKPQTGFSSYSLNDPSPGRKAAIVQVAVGRGWSFLVGVPPPSQLSGGGRAATASHSSLSSNPSKCPFCHFTRASSQRLPTAIRCDGTGPTGKTRRTPGSSHPQSLFAVYPPLVATPESSARAPLQAARSQTGGGGNTMRQTHLI